MTNDDERIVRASIHGDVDAIRALGRLLRDTDDFPHGHPEMDPTDDEREALARLFDAHWMTPLGKCACGWVHPQYGSRHLDPIYVRQHLADAVHDAGFRRSVVPEPSAEDYPDAEALAALRAANEVR